MPRGVYKRKKRYYRKGKVVDKKPGQTSVMLTRSYGTPGAWTTVCELRDDTLFRFDYDPGSIYRKMETVANNEGAIENVLIRREAFKMDGRWLASGSTNIENCNYLATVQVCQITLNVNPPEMGERP
jgi:hypothetical protein